MASLHIMVCMSVVILLSACASHSLAELPRNRHQTMPARWQTVLPQGAEVVSSLDWWDQLNDALIMQLVAAAKMASPSIGAAYARIADARAYSVMEQAGLLPMVNASVASNRGQANLIMPMASTSTIGLSTAWDLDVFGAQQAASGAAQARLGASQAALQDAALSMAVEVVTTYVDLRACEAQLVKTKLAAQSLSHLLQLSELMRGSGLQSFAEVELARAGAASGNLNIIKQQERCELLTKALVALTGLEESVLRHDLAVATSILPTPAEFGISTVPAEVLAQRPDIFAAATAVEAASADVLQAKALRWPRITLNGTIGISHLSSTSISSNGTVWSIGPINVVFPLYDGGVRKANVSVAQARYQAVILSYASLLREAIREVEQALVTLDSAAKRRRDSYATAMHYENAYQITEAAYRSGAANLFDLEATRSSMISAQSSLIELERERITAWIRLYRATGGGWSSASIKQSDQE